MTVQASSPLRLSLVVAMYNEQSSCAEFFARTLSVVQGLTEDFELICVDDGSTDQTMQCLREAHAREPRVKILSLSRNFGKEYALTAGLERTTGDAVVVLDADLQDPPELIPELVEQWRAGHDMVVAVRRERRGDSWLKRCTAALFYRCLRALSRVPIPADAGDFRLLDRRVVAALRELRERSRFMKGLFAWLGFRQAFVYYRREARAGGSSKFGFWKLWNFALDGIFSFSTLLLRIWTYLGLLVAAFAALYILYRVLHVALFGIDVPGYNSLLVTVLFFSGLNMIGLGILGEYLGRVFEEVKGRPLYLVRESLGFEPEREGAVQAPERGNGARPEDAPRPQTGD